MTQTRTKPIEALEVRDNPRNLAEYFMNQCRSWVESGTGFVPMVVAFRTGEKKLVVAFEGFSGTMAELTELVRPPEPNALTNYALLFLDTYFTADAKLVKEGIRVRDVPSRREAVVCTFVSKTDESCVAIWVYDRDAEGRPVFTENIEWTAESNTTVMDASGHN